MPKTFDGIQALAYLKQGYAVRRAEWLEPRHIHRGRAGGVLCETGNSQPLHLDELFEGDWEFYCNPAANDVAPCEAKPEEYIDHQQAKKRMTWEEARVVIAQGKSVRRPGWSNEYARVYWPMNDGAKGAKIDTYDMAATDWEVVE